MHPQKKSGQKSENRDMGCSEYGQKYFGVGRSELVVSLVDSTMPLNSDWKHLTCGID